MREFDVYLTRDTYSFGNVAVWPVTVGIRKFHGCIEYGNAKYHQYAYKQGCRNISTEDCKAKYGFKPKRGTAYNVYTKEGKVIRERIDTEMDFSDYPSSQAESRKITLKVLQRACIRELGVKKLSKKKRLKAINGIEKLTRRSLCPSQYGRGANIRHGFAWWRTEEGTDFWESINKAPNLKPFNE